ncbi:MAG: Zn-ribbon domain-containing OB-fold protein [Acidimicrobiales bacterium]
MPNPQGLNAELYSYWAKEELRFQRCGECGRWRHPPRLLCPQCGSPLWSWQLSSGQGTLYTWTVVHRAMSPAFAADTPYAVIVVEMQEGVRLVSGTSEILRQDLVVGLPVEVMFESRGEELKLPFFRLRASASRDGARAPGRTSGRSQ